MDMASLLPHSKRDVKITLKGNKADTLNELVDLKGCTSCLFFEVSSFQDYPNPEAFVWSHVV